MAKVYLSLGSNIDREKNLTAALDALSEIDTNLILSAVYESESVGFSGDHFFNLVVLINTELSVADLSAQLKKIEDENGRDRTAVKFSARSLDIDILTYDQQVGIIDGIKLPRDEILKNAFVLLPLSEIAADVVSPETGLTYQQHWQAYDKNKQKLWQVEFNWRADTPLNL